MQWLVAVVKHPLTHGTVFGLGFAHWFFDRQGSINAYKETLPGPAAAVEEQPLRTYTFRVR